MFATVGARAHVPVLLAAITFVAMACSKREAPTGSQQTGRIALGIYRATLESPGGELPFGLEILEENGRYVAFIINGAERIRVPEVEVSDGRIEMRMPGFRNRISAAIDGGELEGELVRITYGAREQTIPFAARHGVTHRFVEKPLTDNADVSGRWAATFSDEKSGESSEAVGEFRQSRHEVTGTFLSPTGDHRFLAGDVRNDELRLSAFDGAHIYLYHARINGRGQLDGTFWSGLTSKERFVARRDESATLDDTAVVTAMRAETKALEFRFPDVDGRQVSLDDPRFAGKVVVVTLGGSWCPNCHDEAAFFAPYYLQNRERGLEVVALMFEHFGDFEQAAAATQRFREKFGIEYTTLIAGTSDKEDAAKRLPQLNGVYAFPTTLFLDRGGRVRHIHTGFSGPATGAHHQRLLEEFDAMIEQLLAETGETAAERRPPGV